jgi:hypothetical protein
MINLINLSMKIQPFGLWNALEMLIYYRFSDVIIPIALRKLKESGLTGQGLQINLPVLTLFMPHKLCLSLCSSAFGEIPRPPLWRIIMTLNFWHIFHSDQFDSREVNPFHELKLVKINNLDSDQFGFKRR